MRPTFKEAYDKAVRLWRTRRRSPSSRKSPNVEAEKFSGHARSSWRSATREAYGDGDAGDLAKVAESVCEKREKGKRIIKAVFKNL